MSSGALCEVIFPYQALDVDQISLVVGEKVTVLHKNSTGWWVGRNDKGQVGAFPASYTKETAAERPKFVVPKEVKTSMLQGHVGGVTASQMQSAHGVQPMNRSTTTGLSSADERQMKKLLGIEDEADGCNDVDEDASVASPASSPLYGLGSSTLRTPKSSSGRAVESMNLDRIILLRKEVKTLRSDISKLSEKEKQLTMYRSTDQTVKVVIQREVEQLKDLIVSRANTVQDLEHRIDVLKCALEGQPLPQYAPPRGNSTSSTAVTPSCVSPAVQPLASPQFPSAAAPASSAAAGGIATMDPAVQVLISTPSSVFMLEPTDAELEADPLARKIIKKLGKRIAEAKATRDDYTKQAQKLHKRIKKFTSAAQELDAEIAALQDDPAAGDEGEEGTFSMLSEEEQQAAEKCQLIEVKYMKKAAQFLETQVATNAEAEGLQRRVQKLKEKLSKGDEVASEQQRRKAALVEEIAALEGPVRMLEQKGVEVADRLKAVRASVHAKHKLADAQLAADVQKRLELKERIEKEKKRNELFDEQLAKLLANRSPTPPAAS